MKAKLKNTTQNLCDYCLEEYPRCNGGLLKFGNGIGDDNIIECDNVQPNESFNSDLLDLTINN